MCQSKNDFWFKKLAVEQIVLFDDDIETPTKMIGRKMLPILQKDDGSYLPESLDIVHYVDSINEPKYAKGSIAPEIETWSKTVSAVVYVCNTTLYSNGFSRNQYSGS